MYVKNSHCNEEANWDLWYSCPNGAQDDVCKKENLQDRNEQAVKTAGKAQIILQNHQDG